VAADPSPPTPAYGDLPAALSQLTRSSSSHTSSRATISRRRDAAGPHAAGKPREPTAYWHGSPDSALHVRQRRVRHPRATCRHAAGSRRSCMSTGAYPDSASRSPPGTRGTTRPAMRDGRSQQHRRSRRPQGVTFLGARPDIQWLTMANARLCAARTIHPRWPTTESPRPLGRRLHHDGRTCPRRPHDPPPQILVHPWCTLRYGQSTVRHTSVRCLTGLDGRFCRLFSWMDGR
jgi:hypothetical protein